MKKLLILLLSLFFVLASSAWATIYKWTDERGVENFSDDLSKVPPEYRHKVEEVNVTRMGPPTPSQALPGGIAADLHPTTAAAQAPPIEQALVREGDFAIKLAEALKVGRAQSEAEAESILTLAGITPKNGWIADYPVTPDIIGELQMAVSAAADLGNLTMKKDEAVKVFQDLIAQQGLPVRADERQYAGSITPAEPLPDYGQYSRPEVIENYYYNQGPPIITYYPPPWDYYYLYSWVPYPFWYSGIWFPGFFCLRDFHKVVLVHGRRGIISNHFVDPWTKRVVPIYPATRGAGRPHPTLAHASQGRGFVSPEAKRGGGSIFERSQQRAGPGNSISSRNRGTPRGQIPSNRNSNPSTFRGRVGTQRQPATGYRTGRGHTAVGPLNRGSKSFGYQRGLSNRSGMTFHRPSTPSREGSSFRKSQGTGGFGSRGSLGGLSRVH